MTSREGSKYLAKVTFDLIATMVDCKNIWGWGEVDGEKNKIQSFLQLKK